MLCRYICRTLLLCYALCIVASGIKADGISVTTNKASEYPLVDGVLEEIWETADSVTILYQLTPYEGMEVSEPTTAYVLQDSWAIYFAFRCKTNGRQPDLRKEYRDSQEGDYVKVFLDTFRDGRNAYYFSVNASNVQADGILSANAREDNLSWDGEFYSNTDVNSSGYTVEIAIPWSSIKCSDDDATWGFNLMRHIPSRSEDAYAIPVLQNEGLNIGKFGQLTAIAPSFPRASLELYPSAFVRLERSYGESCEKVQPSGDITLKPNSWVDIQATINPDFSQIESDPFALNLSKYSLYFSEKRPFFVDGAAFFQPSGGVTAGLLQLFYSRQIGAKLIDGSEVPLHTGVRMTAKKGKWEIGSLSALTGDRSYASSWGEFTEPEAFFAAERIQYQLDRSTVLGCLYVGKFNSNSDNQAISFDGTYSTPTFQMSGQLAGSQYGTVSDKAMKWVGEYTSRGIYLAGQATVIGDEFDVSAIGYVPWVGYRQYSLSAGPVLFPESGPLNFAILKVTGNFSREYGEDDYSRTAALSISGSFRNGWGAGVDYTSGRLIEFSDTYNPRTVGFFVQSDVTRRVWHILSFYSTYSYNYRTGYFARSEYISNYFSSRLSDRMSLFISGSTWVEHDPDGRTEEITYRVRPGVNLALMNGMNLSIYDETPFTKSKGSLSTRVGLSFSYNFLPKSWFHIGFNEWQVKENGAFESRQRVFAVKLRHMISL